ncbi:MAG TPA: DUF2997 domain-containing protein [Phycisphaerae bacterium]|nr:DUF2997 domain-containing protein [Phycisphaerae bacterium]
MFRGKHIKLIIGVDGTCQIDAVNFSGPSCKVATEEIAAALGGRVDHQHDKPEARIRERCGDREREGAR